jgi:septum formation protein
MSRSLEYSSIKPKISIILASGSASRKMMLEEAGIEFDIHVSNTDEDKIKKDIASKPFSEQVISLAKAKAKSVSNIYPESIVIGGDQICELNETIFNKPGSKEQAVKNLQLLSGQSHYQNSGNYKLC